MSEEIDFKKLYKSILRNKNFIIFFTFLSFVLSTFYAIRQEHIWKGKFQVVLGLKSEKTSIPSSIIPGFSAILNNNVDKNTRTQVEILKSPLVLMPVFELSKTYDDKKQNSFNNLRYSEWSKNLNVDLIDGTLILEVSYTNTNKESIIPILEEISKVYQNYSEDNRKKSNNNKVSFLNNQIENYKLKTLSSIRLAEEFSNKNSLTPAEGTSEGLINDASTSGITIGSGQEALIKKYTQEIVFLNGIINVLEKDFDSKFYGDKLKTISNSLEGIIDIKTNPILKEIKKTEASLARSQVLLTENDSVLKSMVKRREQLYKKFRETLIGVIKTKIEINNIQIDSNNRENGIFTKYRELIREVKRNESTLANLENQKNTLLLSSQVVSEPWEMITNPELEKFPVGPRKKRMILMGSLLGLFLGSIIAIVRDEKNSLIYNIDEIRRILGVELIDEITLSDKEDSIESIKIIFDNLFDNKFDKNIALLPVGEFSDKTLVNLNSMLEKTSPKSMIKLIKDISKAKNYEYIVFLSTEGVINNKQLIKIKKRIALQKLNIKGLIQIND